MELTLEQRKKLLLDLRASIQKHESKIHAALKADLGKSEFESYLVEIGLILEEISFILKNINSWAKPRKVTTPINLQPGSSYLYPAAFGTVLVIAPWNYPFQLAFSPIIGAIAAGNRVVLKPSEFAPHTSEVIKILLEGIPEDQIKVVFGGVEETQKLLAQKFDYIFFTGSTEVGRIVMRAAAEQLTPVTLELGGKSPCLIEESADIDLTAKRCIWGKYVNAGQTCVAPDYVLVPEHMKEKFLERARHYLKVFFGNDPMSSEDYPRVINEKHFDRLLALIDIKKIVVGGESNREKRYIAPTILADVSWTDKIMEGEIFGPILPVITYKKLDEAITQINQRSKPLAFYIFSEDRAATDSIISKISFGGGCINDTLVYLGNPHLPFGGVGASGMGSYHGKKSFETFTHYKAMYKRGFYDIPLRYPPYKGRVKWLKLFLR